MKFTVKYNKIFISKNQEGYVIKNHKINPIRNELGNRYSVFNDDCHIEIIFYGDWWRIEEDINNCDIQYVINTVERIATR